MEYLISFGNSRQYVLHADCRSAVQDGLKREIRDYLKRKFPEISDIDFYDKLEAEAIDKEDVGLYADYPRFGPAAIEDIKRVLTAEVEDAASLRILNSNAPYDS